HRTDPAKTHPERPDQRVRASRLTPKEMQVTRLKSYFRAAQVGAGVCRWECLPFCPGVAGKPPGELVCLDSIELDVDTYQSLPARWHGDRPEGESLAKARAGERSIAPPTTLHRGANPTREEPH